jgi:hypothetical protein
MRTDHVINEECFSNQVAVKIGDELILSPIFINHVMIFLYHPVFFSSFEGFNSD